MKLKSNAIPSSHDFLENRQNHLVALEVISDAAPLPLLVVASGRMIGRELMG